MIKANELRIGNYIEIEQYNCIRGIVRICSGSEIDQVIKLRPTPIPLTPQILEKCGFRFDEDDDWYVFESEKGFSISHIIGGLTHYFGTLEFLWVDIHNEIKYLHQLQNLYFALTGQELTFKP